MIEMLSLYHGTDAMSARLIFAEGTPVDYHARNGLRSFARELAKSILDALGMVEKESWEIDIALNCIRPGSADIEAWDLWVRSLPSLFGTHSGTPFDYGPLYVTSSFARARRYCADNPYRSEFVRSVVGGLEIARAIGTVEASRAEGMLNQQPACRAAIEAPSDPVVIEFGGFTVDMLRTETGKADLSSDLLLLDLAREEGVDQQLSFRIERYERRHVVAVHDLTAQRSDRSYLANADWSGVAAEVWLASLAPQSR